MRHRQTKGAATDMFDLQPPRHISTLRNFAVALRSGERPLTERTPGVQPAPREPVFMPHTCRSPCRRDRFSWVVCGHPHQILRCWLASPRRPPSFHYLRCPVACLVRRPPHYYERSANAYYCLITACCSPTPMIATTANTAPAANVAVDPTAVQSKPATTLAPSNAAPVTKL